MKKTKFQKLKRELEDEKKELELLEENVCRIREGLIEKVPSRFSIKDVINAFFGSLIFGLTILLKGGLIETALKLEKVHLVIIILFTLIILCLEIYFISYMRVKNRKARKASPFILKRLVTLYSITLVVTFGLIYLLNLNQHPEVANTFENIARVAVLTSFPCAIGAAVPSLLKKY
ncbi:MAG: DUF2391 family protein [Candidatus Nanoarchaeia archaeon]